MSDQEQYREQEQPRDQRGMEAWQSRPPAVVHPKNPAVGVIVSALLPGVGSMVVGRAGMGVMIMLSYIIGWALTPVVIGFPIVFVVWIWGMIDAYQGAVKWNQAHGIIS
jgi:TM2 domain-containing membrane protein YozV